MSTTASSRAPRQGDQAFVLFLDADTDDELEGCIISIDDRLLCLEVDDSLLALPWSSIGAVRYVPEPDDRPEILALLRDNPGATYDEIAATTGRTAAAALGALRALERRGCVGSSRAYWSADGAS